MYIHVQGCGRYISGVRIYGDRLSRLRLAVDGSKKKVDMALWYESFDEHTLLVLEGYALHCFM